MTDHLRLIQNKLLHLSKMRGYLDYSLKQVSPLVPIQDWGGLTPEMHEKLAAFRVRFSEFQEHLGKTMKAVAIEEEVRVETFTSVLLLMEKLKILNSVEQWKTIRELRNAVNHEYEEDFARVSQFFLELVKSTSELFALHDRLIEFCKKQYGINV